MWLVFFGFGPVLDLPVATRGTVVNPMVPMIVNLNQDPQLQGRDPWLMKWTEMGMETWGNLWKLKWTLMELLPNLTKISEKNWTPKDDERDCAAAKTQRCRWSTTFLQAKRWLAAKSRMNRTRRRSRKHLERMNQQNNRTEIDRMVFVCFLQCFLFCVLPNEGNCLKSRRPW